MKKLFFDIISYLKDILIGSTNRIITIFDVIGIVLFLYPQLANKIVSNKLVIRILGISIFLLCFLIANFLTYRKLIGQLRKKPADIKIKAHSTEWKISRFHNSVPVDFIIFQIVLDIKNEGDEQGKLNFIELKRFETKTTLLNSMPSKIRFENESESYQHTNTVVKFPYKVEANYWNTNLSCVMEIAINERDAVNIAREMNELKDFFIEFCYEFEALNGKTSKRNFQINESYGNLKKKILKHWNEGKRHDLLCIAFNIEAFIENKV